MKVTNSDFTATEFTLMKYARKYRIFRCDGLWSASVSVGDSAKILCMMKPKAQCISAINEHIKLYGEPEK